MEFVQNLGKEKQDIRTSIVENTKKMALESLQQEYEKAKISIEETTDLRVLKAMVTRIRLLNTPRWKRDQNKNS